LFSSLVVNISEIEKTRNRCDERAYGATAQRIEGNVIPHRTTVSELENQIADD
jgi:hypothetical protein